MIGLSISYNTNWKLIEEGNVMKKWYDEEYEWEIEVIGFNKDNEETERFCRNGEEIGDKYTCTYGVPYHGSGQKRWQFRKYRRG